MSCPAAVNGYKRRLDESPRPSPRSWRPKFLDSLAQPPLNWQGFLGLRHLDLPSGTVVGQVRFLLLTRRRVLPRPSAASAENGPEDGLHRLRSRGHRQHRS